MKLKFIVLCLFFSWQVFNGMDNNIDYFSLIPDELLKIMIMYLIDFNVHIDRAFHKLKPFILTNKKHAKYIPECFIEQWAAIKKTTQLHVAVELNKVLWVKNYLLQMHHHNELHALDERRINPLMIAMIKNHHELITYLTKAMHNHELFSHKDTLQHTFFSFMHKLYCPQDDYESCIKYINQYCGKSGGDDDDWITPLIYTIIHKYHAMMEFLVQKGAQVEGTDSCGNTPLHIAVLHYDPYAVDFLIKQQHEKDVFDGSNYTPLMRAQQQIMQIQATSGVFQDLSKIIQLLSDQ